MKHPRVLPLRSCLALGAALTFSAAVPAGRAQSPGEAPQLSAEDAAKMLQQLGQVEETVKKTRAANNTNVVPVIRDAASSDAKAVALWIDSVREVDFRDRDRKEADFREWRERTGQRLQSSGAGTAIRLHLQYLLLTLRSTEIRSEGERAELMSAVSAFLDELGKAGKDALGQGEFLQRSVLDSPVARRYKLNVTVAGKARDNRGNTQADQYQLESMGGGKWCAVPGSIGTIYETTLLPYLRAKKDLAKLQAAWTKRIQQEAAIVAAFDTPASEKEYKERTLPELEWAMARDLFNHGSTPAGARLLQIIQQNPTHPGCRGWISELKGLLAEKSGQEARAARQAAAAQPEAEDTASTTTPPEAPAPR